MDDTFFRKPMSYRDQRVLQQPVQQPVQQYAPQALPPSVNPMTLINPMYTQQAPQNSLAPMGMYQAYKSGQMPAGTTGAPTTLGSK